METLSCTLFYLVSFLNQHLPVSEWTCVEIRKRNRKFSESQTLKQCHGQFLFVIPTFFKYAAPTCPHCTRCACVVSVLSRREQDLSPATKLALLQRLSRAQRREQETEDIAVLTERGFGSNRRQFSLVVNSVWRYSWSAFVMDTIASIEIHLPM